jgi:hypothetical protein
VKPIHLIRLARAGDREALAKIEALPPARRALLEALAEHTWEETPGEIAARIQRAEQWEL